MDDKYDLPSVNIGRDIVRAERRQGVVSGFSLGGVLFRALVGDDIL